MSTRTIQKGKQLIIVLGKLANFRNALTVLVQDDKKYGNDNITDFGFNSDNESAESYLFDKQSHAPQSFVDFIKANPDIAYSLAIVTGDKVNAKYPNSGAPKGANEIYANNADSMTPPMTHEELLERTETAIRAMN